MITHDSIRGAGGDGDLVVRLVIPIKEFCNRTKDLHQEKVEKSQSKRHRTRRIYLWPSCRSRSRDLDPSSLDRDQRAAAATERKQNNRRRERERETKTLK